MLVLVCNNVSTRYHASIKTPSGSNGCSGSTITAWSTLWSHTFVSLLVCCLRFRGHVFAAGATRFALFSTSHVLLFGRPSHVPLRNVADTLLEYNGYCDQYAGEYL